MDKQFFRFFSEIAVFQESLVFTKAWLSRKPGYHESLVITKPGYRKVGCHKAWLSESLVVWLLVVAVLFVTVLVVTLSARAGFLSMLRASGFDSIRINFRIGLGFVPSIADLLVP